MTDPTAPLDDIDLLILRIDVVEMDLSVLLDEADRILATRAVHVRTLGDRAGGR